MMIQAAAEYGAVAGGQGSGGLRSGPGELVHQGWTFLGDNPAALVLAILTLLVVVGLLRTGRYRA